MSKHNKIGSNGEQIAADYLLNKGYIILFRNWRSGKKEIDIIAVQGDLLVFVEVKARSGNKLLFPEETVNKKKQSFLKAAANNFMEENIQFKYMRFDIVSVLFEANNVKEIVHFEEAFH